ncbi:MAG: prevent-host-death family protein [Arenicella sp.]|jgi:prevent-host-death family protein
MTKITSAQLQKGFGQYRMEAHKNPIIITNHGRDDLALISAEEYARLRQLDQQAFYAHELDADILDEMGSLPVSKEAKEFDSEYIPA